jgi:hypothetical protein
VQKTGNKKQGLRNQGTRDQKTNPWVDSHVLKGHDFSRAEKVHKRDWGFTGCGKTQLLAAL